MAQIDRYNEQPAGERAVVDDRRRLDGEQGPPGPGPGPTDDDDQRPEVRRKKLLEQWTQANDELAKATAELATAQATLKDASSQAQYNAAVTAAAAARQKQTAAAGRRSQLQREISTVDAEIRTDRAAAARVAREELTGRAKQYEADISAGRLTLDSAQRRWERDLTQAKTAYEQQSEGAGLLLRAAPWLGDQAAADAMWRSLLGWNRPGDPHQLPEQNPFRVVPFNVPAPTVPPPDWKAALMAPPTPGTAAERQGKAMLQQEQMGALERAAAGTFYEPPVYGNPPPFGPRPSRPDRAPAAVGAEAFGEPTVMPNGAGAPAGVGVEAFNEPTFVPPGAGTPPAPSGPPADAGAQPAAMTRPEPPPESADWTETEWHRWAQTVGLA